MAHLPIIKMSRFFAKLLFYLLPPTLYLVSTVGTALYAGEFTPLRQVATLQASNEPLLYGRAYRDNYFAFKLIATQIRAPAFLVLGSSRVMQFRSMLLNKNPSVFYNAGGAAQSIGEAAKFLESLDKNRFPRVVMLGFDQSWLNEKTVAPVSYRRIYEQIDEENTILFNRALNTAKDVFWDYIDGKLSPMQVARGQDPIYHVPALGVNARARGYGFRNDGSYQYGSNVNPSPVKERLSEGFQRLRNNEGHFASGDHISKSGLEEIVRMLRFCKANGIYVIGFSPPFAPSVYNVMISDGKHGYLNEMAFQLPLLFSEFGFPYFDFSDASQLDDVFDDDMIDAFHGSEFVYLQLYRRMLERISKPLSHYSDAKFLRGIAQSRYRIGLELFGNQFK